MYENQPCQSVAWVEFNEIIKINILGGNGRKKRAIAAEYEGENCSESVLLIPRRNQVLEKRIPHIAFLPNGGYPLGCCDDKIVFPVKIVKPEIINSVIVVRDTDTLRVPRDLFEIESPKSKGVILIRNPSEKFETFLFLIKMACRDNEEKVVRFIRKSLIDKEIKIENGIIETMIGISENPEYLMNGFLSNLTEYIKYLSET